LANKCVIVFSGTFKAALSEVPAAFCGTCGTHVFVLERGEYVRSNVAHGVAIPEFGAIKYE
jgi:hypothetical protein